MKYEIELVGCDDKTGFEMDLTKDELAFIERMQALADESSTYCCMPTMRVSKVDE